MDQADQTQQSEKTRENRLRRKALRLGYVVRKDRSRNLNIDHLGGYMIIDAQMNGVVAGSHFDLSLEDVEEWLGDDE